MRQMRCCSMDEGDCRKGSSHQGTGGETGARVSQRRAVEALGDSRVQRVRGSDEE